MIQTQLNLRATLKTSEIMALTGLGRDAVRRLVRNGKLPSIGGRRILVPRAAVEQFLGVAK